MRPGKYIHSSATNSSRSRDMELIKTRALDVNIIRGKKQANTDCVLFRTKAIENSDKESIEGSCKKANTNTKSIGPLAFDENQLRWQESTPCIKK